MRRLAPAAIAAAFALAFPRAARAQVTLPPPPPPTTSPQYVPPPPPSRTTEEPAPRRETRDASPRRRDTSPPDTSSPRRYVAAPSERYERDEAPDARTGFQLAIRTGVALPMGNVTGQANNAMSSTFKAQVPLFVELGAKVTPNVFLGGFTSLSFGGTGNDFRTANGCPTLASRSCLGVDFRIGVEVQYHFQPDQRMNPWLGFGLGYESATASASGGGPSNSDNVSGFEFFKLSGGLDFRVSRLFGVGPWVGLDVGQYGHFHTELGGVATDGSIQSTALHEWFSLGVRAVVFP